MATLGSHIVRGEMHHAMAHAIEGAEAFRGLHDLTGTFVSFLCSDLLASWYINYLGSSLRNVVKGAGQPPPRFPIPLQHHRVSQILTDWGFCASHATVPTPCRFGLVGSFYNPKYYGRSRLHASQPPNHQIMGINGFLAGSFATAVSAIMAGVNPA
ncbi:hypothetical protein E4U44_006408 [Claviceps purpurea]|nr:hypothetical protein E4U44_006408 [Claviceps purpurea]